MQILHPPWEAAQGKDPKSSPGLELGWTKQKQPGTAHCTVNASWHISVVTNPLPSSLSETFLKPWLPWPVSSSEPRKFNRDPVTLGFPPLLSFFSSRDKSNCLWMLGTDEACKAVRPLRTAKRHHCEESKSFYLLHLISNYHFFIHNELETPDNKGCISRICAFWKVALGAFGSGCLTSDTDTLYLGLYAQETQWQSFHMYFLYHTHSQQPRSNVF